MKKLLNLGISDRLPDFQVAYLKNSNIASLVLIAAGLALTALLSIHSPDHIVFGLGLLSPGVFTLALNFFHITDLSRIILSVLTFFMLSVLHAAVIAPGQSLETHFLFLQFVVFLLPWVLFDNREQIPLLISLALLLLLLFGFPLLNSAVTLAEKIDILAVEAVKTSFYVVAFLTAISITFDIHVRNLVAEKSLKFTLQQLEDTGLELEKQEKELQNTFEEISNAHKGDEKRNWIAKGVSQLNHILRNSADKNLYQTVITSIVKYFGANQGGIYEVEENNYSEKCFALKAAYGYDWNKASRAKTVINEAKILKDAYHEKAPIYTAEVPEEYTYIESGLGKTKPKCIFTIPLVYEDNVEGILELSSFKEFQDHEKELLGRMAGILARFIESYQVNVQSQELLEKTNQQTEEMRAQEEEMRQNMEELQATQEELTRKEQEYISRIEELEQMLGK